MTDEHARTELCTLAKLRFGGRWFIELAALCEEHEINMNPMPDADVVKFIGVLSGQLKGGKG